MPTPRFGSTDPLDELDTTPPPPRIVTEPEPEPEPAKPKGAKTKAKAAGPRPFVPPVEQNRKPLNVRLPADLHDRLRAKWKATDEPVQSIVERAVEHLLDLEDA